MAQLRPIVFLVLLATALSAQSLELSTGMTSDNGQGGAMFDLVAQEDLRVLGFDVNLDAGTWDLEIWTKSGTFSGFEQNPAAWTLAASVPSVFSLGANRATRVPAALCLAIADGATLGVYITCTNGLGLNYRNGASVGSVAESDDNLEWRVGSGVIYAFGPFFPARELSGTVYYELGGPTMNCTVLSPADPPPFQPNPTGFNFDLDGVQTTGIAPARVVSCPNLLVLATVAGTVGLSWELAIEAGNLVESGAELPSGTQRLNLNATSPTLAYLFGGADPSPQPLPAPSISLPLNLSSPIELAAQAFFLDPAHADGVVLTQGCELEVVTTGALPSGPVNDEELVTIALEDPPICAGSVVFAGTTWTEVHVSSNGRIQFGTPATDFSPTVSEAMTGPGFLGAWGDLDPGSGGQVQLSVPSGGGLRASFESVPPFLGGGTAVSFAIQIDSAGIVTIDGATASSLENGIRAWRRDVFLGLTPGTAATDPGGQVFTVGGSGSSTGASDMLYRFGMGNQLLAGTALNSIIWTPVAGGGYTWSGQ